MKYTAASFASIALAYVICMLIPVGGIVAFFLYGFIGVAVPGAVYVLLFRSTPEFSELKCQVGGITGRFSAKFKKKKAE